MASTISPPPVERDEETEKISTTENALVTQNAETAVVSAEGNDGEKKTKKIIRRKRRPARPQVDPSTIKSEPPPQTGTVFNIWYNKWSG